MNELDYTGLAIELQAVLDKFYNGTFPVIRMEMSRRISAQGIPEYTFLIRGNEY